MGIGQQSVQNGFNKSDISLMNKKYEITVDLCLYFPHIFTISFTINTLYFLVFIHH